MNSQNPKNEISRRKFLQNSSLATAGIYLVF